MVIRANHRLRGVTHAKVYPLPTELGKDITVSRDECTIIVGAEEADVANAAR